MLKFVFYTKDHGLKVRLPLPEDDFGHAFHWHDKLEFLVSDSSDFMMYWTSLLPDLEPEYAQALLDLVGSRYPISKNYKKLEKECPKIVYRDGNNELVIFAGSFNPWHQGHQACLNLLPKEKTCLVMPDNNPHKELRETCSVATILEISTKAKFGENQFLVPTFLLSDKKNPTIDWVECFKKDYPDQEVSLLMGFDSFAGLKTWIRYESLMPKLSTIYVVSRLENEMDRTQALKEARAFNPELNVIFLGKHPYESFSSTSMRNKYRN